jgi:tetratricopeptide (TPR) repeat protein
MEGRALTNVGVAYAQLGQHATGLAVLEEALAIEALAEHRPQAIETKFAIAVIYLNQGRRADAIALLEEVVRVGRQIEHPDRRTHREFLEKLRP